MRNEIEILTNWSFTDHVAFNKEYYSIENRKKRYERELENWNKVERYFHDKPIFDTSTLYFFNTPYENLTNEIVKSKLESIYSSLYEKLEKLEKLRLSLSIDKILTETTEILTDYELSLLRIHTYTIKSDDKINKFWTTVFYENLENLKRYEWRIITTCIDLFDYEKDIETFLKNTFFCNRDYILNFRVGYALFLMHIKEIKPFDVHGKKENGFHSYDNSINDYSNVHKSQHGDLFKKGGKKVMDCWLEVIE